jgi:hypothetical protein
MDIDSNNWYKSPIVWIIVVIVIIAIIFFINSSVKGKDGNSSDSMTSGTGTKPPGTGARAMYGNTVLRTPPNRAAL